LKILEKDPSSSLDNFQASTNIELLWIMPPPPSFLSLSIFTLDSSLSCLTLNALGNEQWKDLLLIWEMISLVEKYDEHSSGELTLSHSSKSRFHQLSNTAMILAPAKGLLLNNRLIKCSLFDTVSNTFLISLVALPGLLNKL